MRRGFTLIELLAVIVILAIIALIATPIILGIIKDTKKEAAIRSVENYLDAVEIAISNEYLKDSLVNLDGTYQISEEGKLIKSSDKNIKVKHLKAPITGKIFKIKVKDGDKITAGMELYSIEAMKMENIIRADFDATIKKIHKVDNELVNVGEIIVEFE